MTLETIKNYLRIDEDITEDDSLLESLKEASINYIESTTGKAFLAENSLFKTLMLLLIHHWYSNRNITYKSSAVEEFPHSINALVHTIKHNDKFKVLDL